MRDLVATLQVCVVAQREKLLRVRMRIPHATHVPFSEGDMEESAIAGEVTSACEVLTDLRNVRDDAKTSAAVRAICHLLDSSPTYQQRFLVYQVASTRGGVSALLGILRCSDSIPLLVDAVGCVALLVQENARAAHDLASRDVLSVLLPLLFPRDETRSSSSGASPSAGATAHPLSSSPRLVWTRERLPVYEAAMAALRKLTYHSPALQRRLAEMGGIRLVIELSSSPQFIEATSSFSPMARDKFAELTLGKKFIANAAPVPKNSRYDLFKCFPALATLKNGDSYPYYVVDLVTSEREWVVNDLIKTGLVWPSHAPFPEGAEPVWTCVGVFCVEDPTHVWCQFCIDHPKAKLEAMLDILRNIAPPTDNDGLESVDDIPEVGEFCLAYFEPKFCHVPSCIGEGPLWGRGQLLGVEPGAKLRVLSIDYGVTATLPMSHVREFLFECRGIPPFAVPCRVLGVDPIPLCAVVQENAAGVLRNLAYEGAAFRREIIAFRGVEAMLKLAESCDVGVAKQAAATLLNMVASEKEEMGQRGAVESLLALVLRREIHGSVLSFLLAALQTLTTGSHGNLRRLANLQAARKLSLLPGQRSLEGKEREILEAILISLAPPPLSQKPKKASGSGKKYIVYRCLGDQEPDNDGETEGEGETEEGGVSGGVVTTKEFVFNSYIGFSQDERQSFKSVKQDEGFTCWSLQCTICAMANTGHPCMIYVGVSPNGRISGVKMGRKERDSLCVAMDGMMHNGLSPSIKHNQYRVLFVPVVSGAGSRLPETYVLQLELEGGASRKIYTVEREVEGQKMQVCYGRYGHTNVKMSPQELRDKLACEESSEHGREISSLLQNIGRLRVSLDQLSHSSSQ